MKKKRILFIDHIRALAILMVIMCHVIDVNCLFWLGYQEMSGARQIIIYTLLIFGRCGVPLFLMITGYLLLDRDYSHGKWKSFYLHKWLHLFLLTEIWFAIYEAFAVCVQGESFVWKDFILRLLFIEEPVLSHAWYLPMILKLYLLIPLIAQIVKNCKTYRTKRWIIVCLMGINLLLQVGYRIYPILTEIASLFLYISYMIVGVYVRQCARKPKKRISIYSGLLISIGLLGNEIFLRIQYMHRQPVYLWYDNIFVIVMAIGIFVIISDLDIHRNNRIIVSLSRDSFGIYLIHNMIALSMMHLIQGWKIGLYGKMFITYMFVWGVSWVIERGIEKIPYLGSVLLYKRG